MNSVSEQQKFSCDSFACEVDKGRGKQLCSQTRGVGHPPTFDTCPH